jgi:hypothetical protein
MNAIDIGGRPTEQTTVPGSASPAQPRAKRHSATAGQPETRRLVETIMEAGSPAQPPRRKLSTSASDLLAERDDRRPVWIRSPKGGTEYWTGFTRSKLYELAGKGLIRSVSIREPGQVKGVRLFSLRSILEFIERCEAEGTK